MIVDPVHVVGIRSFVPALARADVAAGADGIMVEMHPESEKALSGKQQAVSPEEFKKMMDDLGQIAPAVNIRI